LVGAAILALSIYVLVKGSDILGFDASAIGLPSWWGWVPLGVGICVILMSFMACACTKEGNVCLIFTVGLSQFVFGALVILTGSSLVYYTNTLLVNIAATPATDLTWNVPSGMYGLQRLSADFSIGLYTGCCQLPLNIPPYASCVTSNDVGPCYSDFTVYSSGVNATFIDGSLNTGFCNDVSTVSCGNINNWLGDLQMYAQDRILPSGIAFLVLGSLLLLAFMGTCVVGCKRRKTSKGPRREAQQQPAGTLAYA